jgi:uncharacterized cupredoxin-like copper-binding protein
MHWKRTKRQKMLRLRIVLPTVMLALAASFGVASVATFTKSRTSLAPNMTSITPIDQREQLTSQRITLRATGFEPAEIVRPAGQFLLAVNDRSGQSDTSIMLLSENGERLRAAKMKETNRKHEWREVVNLPPGTYFLSEANHPEWTCRITLRP